MFFCWNCPRKCYTVSLVFKHSKEGISVLGTGVFISFTLSVKTTNAQVSNTVCFSTVPPSVPVERPILSKIESDSVMVSWHPIHYPSLGHGEGSKKYRLEMRELPYGSWTTIVHQTPKWSHEVTGLRPNMDYCFRVSVVTDAGTSPPSNPAYLYRKPGECTGQDGHRQQIFGCGQSFIRFYLSL